MAVAASFATVIASAASIQQSRKSVQAQEKAQDVQNRIADVEAQRKRNLALAQARKQQARIQNLAEQQGTAGSAGALGAVQSISSQTNANLGFLDQTARMSRQASGFLGEASRAQSNAQSFGAIASITGQFADFGKVANLFDVKE